MFYIYIIFIYIYIYIYIHVCVCVRAFIFINKEYSIIDREYIFVKISKVGELSQGSPKGPLFNSYYTDV